MMDNKTTEIKETTDAAGQNERDVMCDCINWAGYGSASFGKHHHVNCPKYHTEKFPYLLYYEEAIDAWTFAPERVEHIVDLDDGDDMVISFKCKSFADAEVAEVPED
jgi:hypothetical protein